MDDRPFICSHGHTLRLADIYSFPAEDGQPVTRCLLCYRQRQEIIDRGYFSHDRPLTYETVRRIV